MDNAQMKLEVDTAKINRLLNELKFTNAQSKRAIKNGLGSAGNVIRKQAQENLAQHTNKDGSKLHNANKLKKYVRIAVYRNADGVSVTILKKKNFKPVKRKRVDTYDMAYVLKFFEDGTKPRYTEGHKVTAVVRNRRVRSGKGGYRGVITGSKFFNRAVTAKQKEAENRLQDAIIENIDKIAKRNK